MREELRFGRVACRGGEVPSPSLQRKGTRTSEAMFAGDAKPSPLMSKGEYKGV